MSYNRNHRHIEERVIVNYDEQGRVKSRETRYIYEDGEESGRRSPNSSNQQNDNVPKVPDYAKKLGLSFVNPQPKRDYVTERLQPRQPWNGFTLGI